MTYRIPMDGLMHYTTDIDQESIDQALPDGHVYGVRLRCKIFGNGMMVPVTALSVLAPVTCLVCISRGSNVR